MTKPPVDRIVDLDGLRGNIVRTVQQKNQQGTLMLLEMEDGRRLWAPWESLQQHDGGLRLPLHTAELPEAILDDGGSLVIPVLVESLRLRKRKRITGGVRVTKRVHTSEQVVEPVRAAETVEVERVPVNRRVSQPPPVRQEGNVTIIPILEEVVVVEKRLILREELRITRRRHEVAERRRVTLRREEVEIERLSGEPHPDDDTASTNASLRSNQMRDRQQERNEGG